MDNNNVNENTEYLNEETEILEPFVDTTTIVPVAPPVAVAPPKVEETPAPVEVAPVQESSPVSTPVVEAAPAQQVAPTPVEENTYEAKEPLKEVVVGQEEKTSNLKYVFTFILFIILGGTIIFMPEISKYMAQVKYERENANAPKIIDGSLKCQLSRSSDRFDMEFKYEFVFNDNKFKKLNFVSETKGDANLDASELEVLYNECLTLKNVTESIDGITVGCDYGSGKVTKTQRLDYSNIDVDKAYTAYSEAGGVYPDYNYLEDMDKIEKNMKAAGYTCERIK